VRKSASKWAQHFRRKHDPSSKAFKQDKKGNEVKEKLAPFVAEGKVDVDESTCFWPCDTSHGGPSLLLAHVISKHLPITHALAQANRDSNKCPHCEYKATKASNLMKHIANQHTEKAKKKAKKPPPQE
jgi:hypothetical protein